MMNSLIEWWNIPSNQAVLLECLSWFMSAIALAGTLMNAERNKWGFAFWLISNLYMSIKFFVIGEHAQGVLFFIYFLLAIRGILSWTKKEKKEMKDLSIEKDESKVNA